MSRGRTVTLVVVGITVLTVVGWIVALALFKAGDNVTPPRTFPPPTTTQG